MGLDYWNPEQVVNFRDVGEFVNMIAGADLLPVQRVFRGGTLRHVESLNTIGNPKTVFNLQKGPDPAFPDTVIHHFPISNDYEKYETSTPEVREWLRRILTTVERGIDFPLYIHCLSGKDRTGVVVATLLTVLRIPRECIVEEYLLSEGQVSPEFIETALDGISPVSSAFKRVDLERVQRELLGTHSTIEPGHRD
jgi:protein-tyrosine phosphatase